MRTKITILCALFTISAPMSAKSAETAGYATESTLSTETMRKLEEGKTNEAVQYFFASSALMQRKTQELSLLTSQISTLTSIYGPIAHCELLKKESKGTLLEQYSYICQHTEFLTYWTLLLTKLPKGWAGANLTLNDRLPELFSSPKPQ